MRMVYDIERKECLSEEKYEIPRHAKNIAAIVMK